MTKRVVFVVLNRDHAWDVEVYRGTVRPAKRLVLKPGQGREEPLDLTLGGAKGAEDVAFTAFAHDQSVAERTVAVDARTPSRLGIVFERDAEGAPRLFVLLNPDDVAWSPVSQSP